MNFSKLTKLLDESEKNLMAPGCGCVVFKGEEQVYRHIAGFKDREAGIKLEGDETYFLYSCSKIMTCAAALTLVDKGLLSLEDKVADYIPEFAELTLTNGQRAKNDLKILHLFTMSGGFTYDLGCDAINSFREKTDGRCPTVGTMAAFSKHHILFEPGEGYAYSLCHDILAAVVEVCSGMKYGDYLKATFFDPLGMNSTFFHTPKGMESKMATKYIFDYDKEVSLRDKDQFNAYKLGSEYESGGAGIISTLDDYAKFLKMLTMGGRDASGREYLKRETIELMRTPAFDDEWQKKFCAAIPWSAGHKYGLGVYVLTDPEAAGSTAHSGIFGWDGAAGAFASIDPDEQITMFYIQHLHGGAGHTFHEKIRSAVYDGIKED